MPQEDHDRRIDYIEYPVPDVAAAKLFYSTVFGWNFTDYGPDYTCFSDGGLAGGDSTFATHSDTNSLSGRTSSNAGMQQKFVRTK